MIRKTIPLIIVLSFAALLSQVSANSHKEHADMHHGKGMHNAMEGKGQQKGMGMKQAKVELSEAAKAGKLLFLACDSCHNEAREPAMAPPMFGVKNHYRKAYPEKEEFIEAIVDFVTKPTKEAALLAKPVEMLGLMPALPLAKEELSNIATYIYEEQFPRPCKHWEIVIKAAEKAGKVDEHIEYEKKKYKRFCTVKES